MNILIVDDGAPVCLKSRSSPPRTDLRAGRGSPAWPFRAGRIETSTLFVARWSRYAREVHAGYSTTSSSGERENEHPYR
jgi:hypothetical protein